MFSIKALQAACNGQNSARPFFKFSLSVVATDTCVTGTALDVTDGKLRLLASSFQSKKKVCKEMCKINVFTFLLQIDL